MRKIFGGFPPHYTTMLRITAKAAVMRLLPLVPFLLAYFQPISPWLRLLVLLCPVLWVLLICPLRQRYGKAIAGIVKNGDSPLSLRGLIKDRSWVPACKGRWHLLRWWALPTVVLGVSLLLLLWVVNALSAVRVLLGVFGGFTAAMSTMATFIPRLLMGEALVQPAGFAASMAMMLVLLLISLVLFGFGMFQTSQYRFGRTKMPKAGTLKPLRRQNLRVWLPTLGFLLLTLVFASRELGLLLSNVLSISRAFTVKLRWYQIVLLVLTAGSYFAGLPIRKYNTAVWAAGGEDGA